MKSMRWRVAITILWLSLLFNIERFDFDKGANVNLTSAFYILVAVASALFMLVRMNQRVMYALGAGVFTAYTIVKVVSPIPVFQGFHKYITITEIVALMITMALAWYVNRGLQDFEEAVEAISLPKGRAGVLDYEQMQERIRTELGRARRHQHPMSLAAIELDPSTSEAALHRAVRDAQVALLKRYVQVQFGVFLSKNTRETDAVAHHDDHGHFLLLAPETPAEQTEGLLSRLSHQVEEHLGLRFRYSVADFPKTALTSEELVHKASEKLRREPDTSDEQRSKPEPAVTTRTADT
ncbi:MAG TPA: hypothetical protein PKK15_07210 [Kouleothrix sp.]|uniref:GGDEF domain-containing protein n=1 Tax=Kouleothrix sp. TaxID=2779161 RepID=UPI002BDA6D29|nr:hypothetical protein [Kouleothrix sp.]